MEDSEKEDDQVDPVSGSDADAASASGVPAAEGGGDSVADSAETESEATADASGESESLAEEVAEVAEEGSAEDEEVGVAATRTGPLEEVLEEEEDIKMDWYILKVQSNRENTICDALRRRVAVEGLERYFGEIMVPTEDVAEFKNGKKKVVKRKLYPGYIVAHMAINDDTWFLVRETGGIGDFTGSQGKPSPMLKHEVERIVKSANPDEEDGEQIKTAIPFKMGDRVLIKEGTFENFEGDVEGIDEANGRVTVMISIFGRSTPFEAEHWQIEAI